MAGEVTSLRNSKEKLVRITPKAVDKLEELLDDDDSKVQLGAAKEILDRGGLPARMEFDGTVEVGGLDDAIEAMLHKLERRGTVRLVEGPAILDAEVVGEVEELTLFEPPPIPPTNGNGHHLKGVPNPNDD